MNRPRTWTVADLLAEELGPTVVWSSPSVRSRVAAELPWPQAEPLADLPPGTAALVVVGGGTLIDEAKAFRAERVPAVRLIAIASVWGSGAESSPVTVLSRGEKKLVRVDASWLPDARVVWPELAETVAPERARDACGDVWAHALEGFLSPLATDDLRRDLANLIREMLALPLAPDARWFELSSRACAAQARSSVGLIHGIAHTVEAPLRAAAPELPFGHAKLCATFAAPVLAFNRLASDKVARRFMEASLDLAAVEATLSRLHRRPAYDAALPHLERCWKQVLRDPCTRTNCALVRPEAIEHFRSWRLDAEAP